MITMTNNITHKDIYIYIYITYNIQHTWWVVFKGSETFLKMNEDCTSYRIHSSSNIDRGNFPYKREILMDSLISHLCIAHASF